MSSKLKSEAIINIITDRMEENAEKAKAVNGVFFLNITKNGKIVKKWSKFRNMLMKYIRNNMESHSILSLFLAIDLKNLKLYEGSPKDIKADTTLTVNDDDFVDIALGKMNPQMAFIKGKLKLAGNVMLTQKLVPLLKLGPKL